MSKVMDMNSPERRLRLRADALTIAFWHLVRLEDSSVRVTDSALFVAVSLKCVCDEDMSWGVEKWWRFTESVIPVMTVIRSSSIRTRVG